PPGPPRPRCHRTPAWRTATPRGRAGRSRTPPRAHRHPLRELPRASRPPRRERRPTLDEPVERAADRAAGADAPLAQAAQALQVGGVVHARGEQRLERVAELLAPGG